MGLAAYGKRELIIGTLILIPATVASVLWLPEISALFVLLFLWLLWFFRDPERRVPTQPRVLVGPANGRVVEVAEVEETGYISGPVTRIAIFLSIFDCHINRAPATATVEYIQHHDGLFLAAWNPKTTTENERNDIGMRLSDPPGGRILVRQIAGAIARRIVCACGKDDTVERGARIGMIKFGSRTEVVIPRELHFRPAVKVGDRVVAGETVLGEFR